MWHVNVYIEKRAVMSMMLMWYASVVIGYDKRRYQLSNASLHIT